MLPSSEGTSRRGFWLSEKERVSLHIESEGDCDGEAAWEEALMLAGKFGFIR